MKDWLRGQSDPSRLQRLRDYQIMHDLMLQNSDLELIFAVDKFERSLAMKGLPERALPLDKLDALLGVKSYKLFPSEASFSEQCLSLIPEENTLLKNANEREMYAYLVGRVLRGALPKGTKWIEKAEGMNVLSTALFSLYQISKLLDTKIDWLRPFHKEYVRKLNIVNTRADGPIAKNWRILLTQLRSDLNVLQDEIVFDIFNHYRTMRKPGKTSPQVMISPSDKSRYSRYSSLLSHITTERFIPSLENMGLRYRCIIILGKRIGAGRFSPPNGTVKMFNLQLEGNRQYGTAILCVEPDTDLQSQEIEMNPISVLLRDEEVSMRTDLYNRKKPGWDVKPWEPSIEGTPGRPKGWLFRKSPSRKKVKITEKMTEIIWLLVAHTGSFTSRRRMTQSLGYSNTYIHNGIDQILQNNLATVLYHPALEFSELTESIIVIVPDEPKKKTNQISEWLRSVNGYSHIIMNPSGKSMFAQIMTPTRRGKITAKIISDQIGQIGADSIIGVVESENSFYFTLSARLLNS